MQQARHLELTLRLSAERYMVCYLLSEIDGEEKVIFPSNSLVVSRKNLIFAASYNKIGERSMATAKLTREEALRRWDSAKATKKAMVEKMQRVLYADYKARTGEEPLQFNVL